MIRNSFFRHARLRVPAALLLSACAAFPARAADNLVSACSGVSLPRSAVTGIVAPVIDGIVAPAEASVNGVIGALGALAGVPRLSIDAAGLLDAAAAGQPVTLRAVNTNGVAVGPTDRCDVRADSFGLANESGIAIGGNRVSGLGTSGRAAVAGDADAIALGNSAATDPAAARAVAIGAGARVAVADSVAIGAGSVAARGVRAVYAAIGLAAPQLSAGEVSVGAAGAERQITNVAAGSAPTDAVNVAQLAGVAAQSVNAVTYDGAARAVATLAGTAGTTLTNVADGRVAAGSSDAVNGGQLHALSVDLAALADGAVQYSDVSRTRIVLGGAGGTTITNVAMGVVAPGSSDAVNGAQLYAANSAIANVSVAVSNTSIAIANNTIAIASNTTAIAALNNGGAGPVRYSDAATPETPNGGTPSDHLTLVGATGGAVGLHDVAVGRVAAGSTDAVNGGQLYATDQAVASAQATADGALALGRGAVRYDGGGRSDVTLGGIGAAAPVALHNVAPGVSGTDAVNVAQLGGAVDGGVLRANAYTDARIAAIGYDLKRFRHDASAGTAGALAAAGLPQAYGPGKGMIALAGGTYRGQSAFAVGMSKAMIDGHTVVKLGGTWDTRGSAGASAGIGYQF